MHKIIYSILALFFMACGSVEKEYKISSSEIEKNLSYLSSDELNGRKTGSEGIEKAAKHIEAIFQKNKLTPYFESYRDSFTHQGKTGYNLVAMKKGSDPKLKDEFIILGAHYDHIGIAEKTIAGDSIANGANDNASGTTAILELAKYFAAKKPKRSILFVLFSAEEQGLVGSKHLSKHLKNENLPLYTMLNFEMIGVPLKDASYSAYLTGYEKSNFAEKFNEYTGKETFGFFEKAKEFQLFRRSDNHPFFEDFHVPAQTLCTFDFTNYEHYHKVGDEANLMDVSHIQNLIEEIAPGVEKMANSVEKEIMLND